MTDLNRIYDELFIELIRNFVFYIPKTILENELFNDIENDNVALMIWFDRIILMDDDLDFIPDVTEIPLHKYFPKGSKLTANSFKIIELKQTLSSEIFQFICTKYLEQLRCYASLSKLLVDYFDLRSPDKNPNIKALFAYQNVFFANHLLEIEKIAEVKPVVINDSELFNNISKSRFLKPFAKVAKSGIIKIDFRDFIKHKSKNEIAAIIKTNFHDLKGIKLRYLLEYLKEENLILINHGDGKKIYNSLKRLFDSRDIGTYNSIFNVKIDIQKDVKYLSNKAFFAEKFKSII